VYARILLCLNVLFFSALLDVVVVVVLSMEITLTHFSEDHQLSREKLFFVLHTHFNMGVIRAHFGINYTWKGGDALRLDPLSVVWL